MRIVLNTGESYKLSELAKAVENSPDDLFYVVKQVDGKDVSFAINRDQLLAGISGGGLNTTKSIIYGGAEWSGTGLVFNTSKIQYNYYGEVGIIEPDSVTLDDGDDEDRFDIIAVNKITDEIIVVKGIPSENPIFPEIPEEYIAVQPVLVKAGATTPDITQIAVYQENEEWVTSTLGTLTGTVDFEATADPIIGSKYVKVAACNRNAIIVFTSNTGNVLYADAQLLTLKIRVTSVIPSNANLVLRNRFNGNNSGTALSLNSLGFNPTLINSVQSIVIPTSYFNAAQGNGLSLQLIHGSINLHMSWDLDNILFSLGQSPVPPPSVNEITIEKEGAVVGARPKLNFIEGANTTIAVVDDPVNDRVNVTITATGGGGGGGTVVSVQGTTNQINVDNSDPANPVLSLSNAILTQLTQIGINTSDIAALDDRVDDLEADIVTIETDIENIQADYVKSTADFDTAGRVVIVDSAGRVVVQGSKLLSDLLDEAQLIGTSRSFSIAQWLDVTALTPVSNVFTANLETTGGSYTADIGANSTIANPVIPSGYSSGKALAWDITCTITGAGGWTIAFGNQYRVDSGVDLATLISDNSTTGDVIQFFFQYKNGIVRVQPFIDTVIP